MLLPYLEVTQSGVIPIAYHFGIPVITSDIEGFREQVVNEKTGIICKTSSDYIAAMSRILSESARDKMKVYFEDYSRSKLDCTDNIRDLLLSLSL